jgi:hypothetical protein
MPEKNLQPMDLGDLPAVEVKVRRGGKTYVLREADGEAARQYRNAAIRAARMTDGEVTGIDGAADVEPLLVSLCLYYANDAGTITLAPNGLPDKRTLVPLGVIKSWTAAQQKSLFDRAVEISGLRDEQETVESLEKQIGKLQKQLTKLRAKGKDSAADLREEEEKNWPDGTAVGSGSLPTFP